MGGGKARPVTCQEFKKVLASLGFYGSPGKGSHEKWIHPNFKGKKRNVTISCHNAPFHRNILTMMIKQTGLSKKEFMNCLASHDFTLSLAE